MEKSCSKNLRRGGSLQKDNGGKVRQRFEKGSFQFTKRNCQQESLSKVMAEYLCDFNNLEEATTETTLVSHRRNFFPNAVRHFNFRSCLNGSHWSHCSCVKSASWDCNIFSKYKSFTQICEQTNLLHWSTVISSSANKLACSYKGSEEDC